MVSSASASRHERAPVSAAPDWAAELGLPADVGIVARLVRLDLFVRRVLDDLCAAEGIAVPDYLVLAVVRRSPGGRAAPSRLCRILDRTSGGMSLALDRLESAGWLVRSADPHDGRRVVVELTPTGLALATRVNASLHEWEASLELTGPEQARIGQVVDGLLDRFATREVLQSSTEVSAPVATS
jgi:DNA-binding MarR family transcriptional regulator